MTITNQTCPIDQKLTLTLSDAQDAKEHPVTSVPNPITWSFADSTGPSFGTITPSANTLSCEFDPAGPLGTFAVNYSTNTDPDANDAPLTVIGTIMITTLPGKAVSFTVTGTLSDNGIDAAAVAADAPPPAPAPAPEPAPAPAPAPAPTDSGNTDAGATSTDSGSTTATDSGSTSTTSDADNTPAPAPVDSTSGDASATTTDAPAATTAPTAPTSDPTPTPVATPTAPTDGSTPAAS